MPGARRGSRRRCSGRRRRDAALREEAGPGRASAGSAPAWPGAGKLSEPSAAQGGRAGALAAGSPAWRPSRGRWSGEGAPRLGASVTRAAPFSAPSDGKQARARRTEGPGGPVRPAGSVREGRRPGAPGRSGGRGSARRRLRDPRSAFGAPRAGATSGRAGGAPLGRGLGRPHVAPDGGGKQGAAPCRPGRGAAQRRARLFAEGS